jgi:hypothetical protein
VVVHRLRRNPGDNTGVTHVLICLLYLAKDLKNIGARNEFPVNENECMMSNQFQVSPHTVFVEAPRAFSAAKDLHHTFFSNALIGRGYVRP